MAINSQEPRALTAALAGPAFRTRSAGMAVHAATRHVERWAPEANANRVRSLRALGFVDRLVAPWIESAQRSASLRLFSQYATRGPSEREGGAVSWVFPRPWYQDELDWMAAARQQAAHAATSPDAAPRTMFTTRGTYVAASSPSTTVVPAALHEYVAPSLSIAEPRADIAGVGFGGSSAARADAYSPLVPLAAVQAAELMSRTVAPLVQSPSGGTSTVGRVTPALRQVLTAMLERAATARATSAEASPSRLAMQAPEMVTPPAPRADGQTAQAAQTAQGSHGAADPATQGLSPSQLADHYAEQRARIVEVQRIAQQAAQRELQQRTELELRERAAATTPAATPQASEAQQQVERARAVQQQRLHEQARAAAAEHARQAALAAPSADRTESAERRDEVVVPDEVRAPAEVAAAIAALPPELATYLASRPTRPASVAQAISELTDVLRTAELLVRSNATSAPFEPTRGPRVVMPAGLGGLVASVDRAQAIRGGVVAAGPSPIAAAPAAASAPAPTEVRRRDVRVPSLPFLRATTPASPASPVGAASTTALGATAAATPAGLAHIAWADRWLARFAGAAPQSLDVLTAAASPSPHARLAALASAAPDSVFVAPVFDTARESARLAAGQPARGGMALAPSLTATTPAAAPTQAPATVPGTIERFDDDAETPDDVFAQIAAAAAARRATPAAARPAAPSSAPVATIATPDEPRATVADALAHAAPSAPGAGLSAQIAASPFAPALRHVLPSPATASFDVRALFGAGLSATYLAGLLEPAARELVTGLAEPAWASRLGSISDTFEADRERSIPEWDATYVAPELPHDAGAIATDGVERGESAAEPLTTLRTALLSWTVDDAHPGEALAPRLETIGSVTPSAPALPRAGRTASHAMLEAMSLPLLADPVMSPVERAASWTSPGMVAQRAEGWSVAQERSVSDLSFDFVPPELVLAARVYGLGPAEAAQALRLAIGGPGQLTAMASAVDRTFVQALSIEAERRDARSPQAARGTSAGAGPSITTAYPLPTGEVAAAMAAPAATAFGVERRAPRGAFLWPSTTVSALGLTAAAPDGEQSMSVAALELLAAQAVAELGTYAALGERGDAIGADGATDPQGLTSSVGAPQPGATDGRAAEPSETDVLDAAVSMVPAARRARFEALYVALAQSPTARSWSPAARAARALALAGRGDDAPLSAYERAASAWDVLPVVYATEGTLSTGEAAEALAAATSAPGATRASTLARRAGLAPDPVLPVDVRPGLGALSARAGEALGSYVTASPAPEPASASSSSSSSREVLSPAMRAPTAAQELVRTGRPAGRHGGGEVEIPPWFEAAARKMLEERSGASDGISLAELTLVSAAPSSHVAASKIAAPSAAPLAPSPASAAGQSQNAPQIDVEKLANEVYRQILIMMDAARARNGEPYL